jgi:hypothetical protein
MKRQALHLAGICSLAFTLNSFAAVLYVDLNSTNPVSPYTNWASAATNIQDAIDAASDGDQILVTNGVYRTGGCVIYNLLTNRMAVTKPLTVESLNGPSVTIIEGNPTLDTDAVRCAYLTNGATLTGFTLTNGSTLPIQNENYDNGVYCGGGIWCESAMATVSNCVITHCLASDAGGGVSGGTLFNCVFITNSASDVGGGTESATVFNSQFFGNAAELGGGAYASALYNCILEGNTAVGGGGAINASLNNCTCSGNSASWKAGGASCCTLTNCILYDNTAPEDTNYWLSDLNYCCTMPLPDNGVGNITNGPLFVDQANGNLRLQSNSPCINAGNNASVTVTNDFEGNPRIVGGTVDIGAYECQSPALLACYIWLQNHGLPTDASAVYADSDGDGMNNWQEWRCDTNPTNSQSVLRMMSPVNDPGGILVQWQSTSTRSYFLERATNLASQPPFSSLASNIVGQAGTTSYTDTTATNGGPFFYRVGVQ